MDIVVLTVLAALIVIFGGIGVYLGASKTPPSRC
jgi:hypothetical protein